MKLASSIAAHLREPFRGGTMLRVALGTVAIAAVLGYLVARSPSKSVLLVSVVALTVGVVLSREFALGAILFLSLTMLGFSSTFDLPGSAMLVTVALVGLFAMTALLDIGPKNPLRVPWTVILLLAALGVSALAGIGNRLVAIYALTVFVAGPVAYVAIMHANLTIDSLKRLSYLVLALMAVQLPLVLIQSRFIATHVDQVGGTFGTVGGTHVQAVVMAFVWTAAIAVLWDRRRSWLVWIGIAVAIVLLVSEAKAGFMFAAIGTIVVGVVRALANPKRGVPLLVAYVLIGVMAFSILFVAYMYLGDVLPGGEQMATYWTEWLRNPATIRAYLFSYNNLGNADRLEGIRLILSQPMSTADLLIGQGIGLLTRSELLGQASVPSSASIAGALDRATSAAKSLYEVGLIGTLLYLAAIGAAAQQVLRAWRSEGELGIGVGGAAWGCAIIFALSSLYMTSWHMDAVAVLFWCALGMAVKWGRLRSAEKTAAEGASSETASALPAAASEPVAPATS